MAAVGVTVPDWLGDPEPGQVGRDVVDEKRFESEALLRRYGRVEMEDSGDFPSLRLCTEIDSESDSCGDIGSGMGD